MSDDDYPRSRIISFQPAPSHRPLMLLTAWRSEDGWWEGYSEPVVYVALVATTYANGETERELEPVIYDVNSVSGFNVLSEIQREEGDMSWPASTHVVPPEVLWDEVVRQCQSAEQNWAYRQRKKLERMVR